MKLKMNPVFFKRKRVNVYYSLGSNRKKSRPLSLPKKMGLEKQCGINQTILNSYWQHDFSFNLARQIRFMTATSALTQQKHRHTQSARNGLKWVSSFFSLLALILGLSPVHAHAQNGLKTKATLVSEYESIRPGQSFTVALKFNIAEHWHTYWRNAGDAGLATQITWDLPEGFVAGPIQWPYPKRLPVPGEILNFGYEGEVWHLVEIQAPAHLKPGAAFILNAKVDWLECAEICVPGQAELRLQLQAAAPEQEGKISRTHAASFLQARKQIPQKNPNLKIEAAYRSITTKQGQQPALSLTLKESTPQKEVAFFPYAEEFIINNASQEIVHHKNEQILTIVLKDPATKPQRISGVIVGDPGWGDPLQRAVEMDLEINPATTLSDTATSTGNSLMGSLLLAFIGGLILNLMPCVFPVLGLKIMSFAK
jgi:DsbC/DsbD-like thiol-disulfide interchange protein